MASRVLIVLHLALFCLTRNVSGSCAQRSVGKDKIVCVCNRTFCDELEKVNDIPKGKAAFYETNKAGERFHSTILSFSSSAEPGEQIVKIDRSQTYQEILGFGGAFTDAVGINLNTLPHDLQDELIKGYFSDKGLSYNFGRVPMAGCDFSTHIYSYDETPYDYELEHFQLTEEDYSLKIPFMLKAISMSKHRIFFIGTPWTLPAWMKVDNNIDGTGGVKGKPGGKYHQIWADYIVKFLQEYEKNNITFWGVTPGNEPYSACFRWLGSPTNMCTPPERERDFIKLNLGPTLRNSGYDMKILIIDDVRGLYPEWPRVIYQDEGAAKYASGSSVHWYGEYKFPFTNLDAIHKEFPDKFILATEACNGDSYSGQKTIDLGSWERGESYALDVIENLLHWSAGWIDWNLALDMQGGPNRIKNFVDSAILINATNEEFYKQPTYYALAHFSKFLVRGSHRIGLRVPQKIMDFQRLNVAAFRTPEDRTVFIVVNRNSSSVNFTVHDADEGYISINVDGNSIHTYEWKTSKSKRN